MNSATKIMLAAFAIPAVLAAAAPQREIAARPAFETATIKLSTGPSRANVITQPSPNRLSIPGMTLMALVYAAYGDGGFNTSMSVRGVKPDWANQTVYAIEGSAAAPATPRQMRLMLQSLLEERFALRLHDASDTDAAIGDVLTLVVDRADGRLGPKVKPWDGTCPAVVPPMVMQAPQRPLQRVGDQLVVGPASAADDPDLPYCPTGFRPGGMRIDGATMSTVAQMLSLPPGRVLLNTITVDRTGLTGRYTLDLDYLFTGSAPPPDFAGPSLSTAIKEQWGLRLVPGKARLKLLIIDEVQPPTPN
jgi:uncharacterized protein (TIGR03435 family)